MVHQDFGSRSDLKNLGDLGDLAGILEETDACESQ
jgi:hypothetical protein